MSEMELRIQSHVVDCIIGVWDHERVKSQRVGLDLKLKFDGSAAARSDRLADTINYAQLAATADFILQHGRFQLLESAVGVLARHFLLPFIDSAFGPAATMADVRLTKFDALPEESLASIRTEVSAAELKYDYEQPPWGRVAIISKPKIWGSIHCRLRLARRFHYITMSDAESEFIMDDGLVAHTRSGTSGFIRRRGRGMAPQNGSWLPKCLGSLV